MRIGLDDVRFGLKMKCTNDLRNEGRGLEPAICVNDKSLMFAIVYDPPSRKLLVFMHPEDIRKPASRKVGRSKAAPRFPYLIVPPRMSKKIPVGLCLRKEADTDDNRSRT
jgi:hypothetical protein